MWWRKLALVLMLLMAVALGWAQGATPAQAAGPSMSLGASGNILCDSQESPTKCTAVFLPGAEKAAEFKITVNADVIPESGYAGFEAQFDADGLAWNLKPSCQEEVVWPDVSIVCARGTFGGGQIAASGATGIFAPFPKSTHLGTLWAPNMHCVTEGTSTVMMMSYVDGGFQLGTVFRASDKSAVLVKTTGQQQFDVDGDTVAETVDVVDTLVVQCALGSATGDSDGDGCLDTQELGANPATGGQRWPLDFWDFYDTPDLNNVRDKAVTIVDLFAVGVRFGATGDPGGDPLAGPIPPAPGYHTAFDRGDQVGDNSWNRAAADGAITIGDIVAVALQFGHTCA